MTPEDTVPSEAATTTETAAAPAITTTGCSLNIVFFPRILESLPPLPCQHSTASGCTKNYQPIIGVTVHLHCVESFDGLLQRCRRGGGVAVKREKHNFS